jgi:hypothetical protein
VRFLLSTQAHQSFRMALFVERELPLRLLVVLTQFIERHAFENGVGTLLRTSAACRGHQFVHDSVVGDDSVRHSVSCRVLDAGSRLHLYDVKLTRPVKTTITDQEVHS